MAERLNMVAQNACYRADLTVVDELYMEDWKWQKQSKSFWPAVAE